MALFDLFKKKKDEFEDLGMPESMGGDFPPIDTGYPGPDMGGLPPMGPPQGRGFPQPQNIPSQYQGFIPQPIQPISIPMSGPQQYGQMPQQQQFDMRTFNDMFRSQVDLIVSKVDSMKATLDRINERLDYIERYLIGRR